MCSNVSYWHSFYLLPVPIANGSTIDVWIQGEKYAGGYIFHDGSPFPTDFGTGTFCPVELNSDPNEIGHMDQPRLNAGIELNIIFTATCANTLVDLPFEKKICTFYRSI